jgi:diguanylate cyclase (GGDEF)-like protein
MKYLAGLKKVTALLAEGAPPLVSLQAILETAADFAIGKGGELCIPPDQLNAIVESGNEPINKITLGDSARIVTSGLAMENAVKCKQDGDPVAFEDGSHVILSLSCGTLTVYEPKLDASSYTDQILGLKILADLADEVINKSVEISEIARQLGSKDKTNHQLLQRNMTLRELAMFDDLTGLFNKRFFDHCLESELTRFRKCGQPFGMALVVLDYLEDIRNRLGYAIGDAAVYHIGRIAGQHVRAEDILAFCSPGKFVILFPDTNLQGSFELAEHVRTAIDGSPLIFENGELHVSVSASVAEVAKGREKNADELVRTLEEALSADADKDHNRVVAVN